MYREPGQERKQDCCPNCYDPLTPAAVLTSTGHLVCDDLCAAGWMQGERALRYLSMVARLKELLKF